MRYNVDMAKILISGIPGAGKTTVATYLAEHYGYKHVDMEADLFAAKRELSADTEGFLGSLAAEEDIVLSWGFSPYVERPLVDAVLGAGFAFVWLDGDHVASLRNFLERENGDPHKEADYYGQMMLILSTGIVEDVTTCVNPFSNGKFRPVEDVAQEILTQVELR